MEGENEDGAISTGLAKRAPTDARVPRGLAEGHGEESADGVGNCARASQPLANERTDERASVRASERASDDEPAPLEQLPSSFRVVLDIPSVSEQLSRSALLKKVADLHDLKIRAHKSS